MRVILLRDVAKIGRKYDIKNVADGYALNHLIPQGHAKVATPVEIKKIEELKLLALNEKKIQEDLLLKNLAEINGKEVTMKAKANDKGHLFAQLHTKEIVEAIKNSIRAAVHPDFLVLDKPIKETGLHEIPVRVGDKKAVIKLLVEADN